MIKPSEVAHNYETGGEKTSVQNVLLSKIRNVWCAFVLSQFTP